MRLARLFCLGLVGTTVLAGQTRTADPVQAEDRYSIGTVKSALEFLKKDGGSSGEMKQYLWPLMGLGDRVSVAVLKIYSANELLDAKNTGPYLTAVRNAFSSRRSVHDDADADPKLTLFVLDYLKEKEVSDPGIEKRITYMEECVKNFTCSSQGEDAFFHNSW